jgi:hypothetical protein
VLYRFDEARRSARSLFARVPSGGPVQALPGPGPRRFQQSPEVEEGGPIQAKTDPFAFNHADGGRAWQRNQVPGPSEYPPRTFTARSPPAAAIGRWPCALSSRRGEDSISEVFRGRMKTAERSWFTLLPLREKVAAEGGRMRGRASLTACASTLIRQPIKPSSGPVGHLLPQGEKDERPRPDEHPPLERDVVVLLPGVGQFLALQALQPAHDPPPGAVRHDHVVDIAA